MNKTTLSILCCAAASPLSFAGGQPIPQEEVDSQGQVAVTRPGLVEGLLKSLASAESEGAWRGGEEPEVDSRVLLAFLGNGDSVGGGNHQECMRRAGTKFLKRFSRQLGSPYGDEPENDLGHALALTVVADFWIEDGVTGAIVRTKSAAAAAIKRQDKDGLWGVGDEQPEVTARMILGLCSARSAGMDISQERLESTFASMDAWMDPESGAAKKGGDMTDGDVLSRTSAVVTAMLLAGRDPSEDEVLALSIQWLSKKLSDPKVTARWESKNADPAFWEWTTYATLQLFKSEEHLKRWSISGTKAMGRDAVLLIEEETLSDPAHAAGIVMAINAVFRFAPGAFAPARDAR